MKTAAVSEIKAALSEYLARVKAGEEVMITERGKPIAKIVPLRRDHAGVSPHLLALEQAGLARLGTGSLPDGFWDLPRPQDAAGGSLDALLKEREEER